jgi:two-component system chemotaxis response regulator CheY
MPLDVLIVDDSAVIRKILQLVLAQTQVPINSVLEARDGNEALNRLKTEKINLVLSDINMPNMDGLQLLVEVRANDDWKNLPVLMITTEGSQAKMTEAAHLGATGYVRKPFTAAQIRDKLANILADPA